MTAPHNRLTPFWRRPPEPAPVTTDRDIRARLESLVRTNPRARIAADEDRYEVLLLTDRVLLEVDAGEVDFVFAECRRVRGERNGVPLLFTFDEEFGLLLRGGGRLFLRFDCEIDY